MAHVEDRWYREILGPDKKKERVPTARHGVGLRYRVRYIDPAGRERSKSFPDRAKRAADDFLISIEGDKLRGTYVDPVAGRVKFSAYAENWLKTHVVDESSRETMESRLRRHILPYFGRRSLNTIKPSDIRAWDAALALTLADNTRSAIFAHLNSILAAGVDDELLSKNPCSAKSIHRPRAIVKEVVPWTRDQVAAIRAGLAERYRLCVDLGVGCGLRQGEIFGLAVDDLEVGAHEEAWLHVRRQLKNVRGHLVFGLPKNDKSRRIPVAGELADRIRTHMAMFPPVSVSLPWEQPDGPQTTVTLIMTTTHRNPIRRESFNGTQWHRALGRAGIAQSRSGGMHALRHTYASVLLDAGENIKALSRFLGHSDPALTLRIYTHLMPSSENRTRAAIDALMKGQTAQTRPTDPS
ncbi:tyrosine-type recombinase/integrase [Hamadaea tsunoensis]|uniref:tyrosine-type recombinase/integrase n=1 Tax=Hamadaea tsunoensis TaxID=53368 RepID=UPI0004808F30|nr:site-specific integrase [Hamadaea tsunoensis]